MDFGIAINRVLGIEGGYVNDPNDPGGETQWGISKRSYPHLDIKSLTRDAAIAIYKTDFWDAVAADKMPGVLAYQALDFAVNSSPRIAIQKLQRALGVADDGHWGPITAAKMLSTSLDRTTFRFLAERLEYMTNLIRWKIYSTGWARRVAQDMRYAAEDLP